MKNKRINFENIYPAGKIYTRGVRSGNILFISGTTAKNSSAQGKSHLQQLDIILHRITSMVKSENGKPSDIVKLTTFVTNKSDWWPINSDHEKIFQKYFKNEFPTNSVVEVNALVEDGLDIEIEAIAIIT